MPCSDDGYCGNPSSSGYQRHIYSEGLKAIYNWYIAGDWTLKEIKTLYQTGWDVEQFVDRLTNGNGLNWMRENMGGVLFYQSAITHQVGNNIGGGNSIVTGMVPTGLPLVLLNQITPQTITHELAHVWDNNSAPNIPGGCAATPGGCPATYVGGGRADDLASFLGGTPSGVRWSNGLSGIPLTYGWDPIKAGRGYGNNSTADYFAETFSWAIYDTTAVPMAALFWIEAIISLGG